MALRVLFFGMEGIFSRAPLLELIKASFDVCAIVVPRPALSQPANEPIRLISPPRAPESDVPLLFEPRDLNIIGIAWNAGIDVYETNDLKHAETIETLTALKPDVICVACFPLMLPPSLVTTFPSLNLHPSILPNYRGPAPLFWIFHDGLEHAGVTVHLIDMGMDTGDIVAQERVRMPDGIRYSDAERVLSERAAHLLVRACQAVERGKLAHTPQPSVAAPRATNPTDRDYVITPDWAARRAFNFIRGIGEWDRPITLELPNKRFLIRDAVSFDEQQELESPLIQRGPEWHVQMQSGALVCTLTPLP